MTDTYTTPKVMSDLLGVTDRTVRRMGRAYREVYGQDSLPPDPRHPLHFVFPAVAVERLQQVAATMRDHPGLSTVEVLEALRDGATLPEPRTRPAPTQDALEPVLAEVQKLRVELADLRRYLLGKLGPGQPDIAPAAGLPDSAPALILPAPSRPVQLLLQPPARLQVKHQELLEALQQSESLRVRPGGRTGEIVELHDIYGALIRPVDPRTVAAMLRHGLLERVGDQYRAAPEAFQQVMAASAPERPDTETGQDAGADRLDQDADSGQPADTVSEPDPAPTSGTELPRFKGRAAELFRRLQDGAELADDGGPMLMLLVDGKPTQSYERATAQRLLAVEGLLVQVASGRWTMPPRLLT